MLKSLSERVITTSFNISGKNLGWCNSVWREASKIGQSTQLLSIDNKGNLDQMENFRLLMSYTEHSRFINEAVFRLGIRLKRDHTASVKKSTRKTMSTRDTAEWILFTTYRVWPGGSSPGHLQGHLLSLLLCLLFICCSRQRCVGVFDSFAFCSPKDFGTEIRFHLDVEKRKCVKEIAVMFSRLLD